MTTGYDSLGRVTSYRDADDTVSTTSYDIRSRPVTIDDGKGTQTLSYNPDSGLLTQLDDSHAGGFTASYDPDGQISTATYPNGVRADFKYDEIGAQTDLTYARAAGCTTNCWVEDHVTESIHGQWLSRQSKLSSQDYSYDKAGRLAQGKDTPAGQGCTTRSYTYDADSNRLSRTTRAPAAGGACDTNSAGQVQSTTYDAADRITSTGFTYDEIGRTKSVPASHSGGGALASSYYVNDMIASQGQDGVSRGWLLDPTLQRHRATAPNGGNQEILHYKDGSDSPSWTVDTANGTPGRWSRNIEGITGDLSAIHDSQTGTTLQLTNLHGDIVATASLSTSDTEPLQTFEADEFGNPRTPSNRRYAWLGGKQRRTEFASGVVQMGVRSYVPAMGRFTSVDPVVGGSASAYDYAGADPVNNLDLDGLSYGPRNGHCGKTSRTDPSKKRCGYICGINVDCSKNSGTLNRVMKRCAQGFGFGLFGDLIDAVIRGRVKVDRKVVKRVRLGPGGCIVDAFRGK